MKNFLFTLMMLLMSNMVIAQLYVAPKFGLNGLASFRGEEGLNFNVNEGYQFGAELGYTAFDLLGLKLSLMYSNRAFNQTAERVLQESNDVKRLFTETLSIRNGTLQMNGGLQLSLGERFELNVGPQLDLLMASKATGIWDFEGGIDTMALVNYDYLNDAAGEGAYWDFEEKDGNYFNSIFLGINIGLGFELIRNLFLELRTNYGVSDFINDFYQSDGNKLNTREFDLIMTASYRFHIRKSRKQKEEEIIEDLF